MDPALMQLLMPAISLNYAKTPQAQTFNPMTVNPAAPAATATPAYQPPGAPAPTMNDDRIGVPPIPFSTINTNTPILTNADATKPSVFSKGNILKALIGSNFGM